jgi:putative transposase
MTGHRRSIRLKSHDYRKPGSYFVTIVTHAHARMFGRIENGRMHLSPAGIIARDAWLRIPVLTPWIRLDEWVVMPDHLHGILHFGEAPLLPARENACTDESTHRPRGAPAGSLGAIIAAYKGASGGRINKLKGTPGAKTWHRNYYEAIIRHQAALDRIRRYILLNPLKWETSRKH